MEGSDSAVAAVGVVAPAVPEVTNEEARAEAYMLGLEAARAYRSMVESYRSIYKQSTEEALRNTEDLGASSFWLERAEEESDPGQLTWWQWGRIADHDPEAAQRVWERVKRHARRELDLGAAAARVVEPPGSDPLDRARFIAVRSGLIADWRPTGDMELRLIEAAAQAWAQWEYWLSAAVGWAEIADFYPKRKDLAQWEGPRLTKAEAMEKAQAMADRWNRIFLRNLRALRDLRRYGPTVNIQNLGGQVNVAERQVNVAGEGRGE